MLTNSHDEIEKREIKTEYCTAVYENPGCSTDIDNAAFSSPENILQHIDYSSSSVKDECFASFEDVYVKEVGF